MDNKPKTPKDINTMLGSVIKTLEVIETNNSIMDKKTRDMITKLREHAEDVHNKTK